MTDYHIQQKTQTNQQESFLNEIPKVRKLPYASLLSHPCILSTHDNQFRCFQLSGNSQAKESLWLLKMFVKKSYEKAGYTGFSMDVDHSFDTNASYFYVLNQKDKLVACLRVIIKTDSINLPSETAQKNSNSHYSFEGKKFAEITSFAALLRRTIATKRSHSFPEPPLTKFSGLSLLFSALGNYTFTSGIQKCLILVDQDNKSLEAFYKNEGFSPSSHYDDLVLFSDYGKLQDEQLVATKWRLFEMDLPNIKRHSKNTRYYQRNTLNLL